MSIDQLDLILCDMYKIDIYMPPYFKRREEFEKASYSIWAIDELKSYIADRLYPRRSGSINEFIKYTNDFIELVSRYSKITPASQLMFSAARNVATNVNDLFRAMK